YKASSGTLQLSGTLVTQNQAAGGGGGLGWNGAVGGTGGMGGAGGVGGTGRDGGAAVSSINPPAALRGVVAGTAAPVGTMGRAPMARLVATAAPAGVGATRAVGASTTP